MVSAQRKNISRYVLVTIWPQQIEKHTYRTNQDENNEKRDDDGEQPVVLCRVTADCWIWSDYSCVKNLCTTQELRNDTSERVKATKQAKGQSENSNFKLNKTYRAQMQTNKQTLKEWTAAKKRLCLISTLLRRTKENMCSAKQRNASLLAHTLFWVSSQSVTTITWAPTIHV